MQAADPARGSRQRRVVRGAWHVRGGSVHVRRRLGRPQVPDTARDVMAWVGDACAMLVI